MQTACNEWTEEDEAALYEALLRFQEGWKAAGLEIDAHEEEQER